MLEILENGKEKYYLAGYNDITIQGTGYNIKLEHSENYNELVGYVNEYLEEIKDVEMRKYAIETIDELLEDVQKHAFQTGFRLAQSLATR